MGVDTVPEFLNTDLLRTAIKSYKNDESIEIEGFEVTTAFGEHFGSQMYRAKIDFKSTKYPTLSSVQSLPVVIKIKPLLHSMLTGDTEIQLFKTEIDMYQKVLPAIDDLYQRNGQSVEFAPEWVSRRWRKEEAHNREIKFCTCKQQHTCGASVYVLLLPSTKESLTN